MHYTARRQFDTASYDASKQSSDSKAADVSTLSLHDIISIIRHIYKLQLTMLYRTTFGPCNTHCLAKRQRRQLHTDSYKEKLFCEAQTGTH